MKWIWLLVLLALPITTAAQAPLVGNYDVNSLTWDWSPGPLGGEPIKTFVRCGVARGGPYNVIPQSEVLMPLQEIRFNKMVPRPGKYFCLLVGWNNSEVVNAVGKVGEGPSSDEIPLDLKGSVPPKPINARVK